MIDAMKQALEALEWGQPIIEDYGSKEQLQAHLSAKDALYKAIEADMYRNPDTDNPCEGWNPSDMAHRSGGLSVEQAEKQEPVAWIQEDRIVPEIGYDCTMTREHPKELGYKPLYTAPQKYCPSENNAAYEKGFVEGMAKQMHSSVDRAVNAMTKPWVGLTDEKIKDMYNKAINETATVSQFVMFKTFARAIEAKLKEKNNG